MGMGSNEPISFGDEPREESSYKPLLSCCKLVILSRHCLVMPASNATQSDNSIQTDTPRNACKHSERFDNSDEKQDNDEHT